MTTDLEAIAEDANGGAEPLVTAALRTGFEALWKASKYARNAGVDPWDFAVEISEARAAGLANSDLRWLVVKGYVDHADEIEPESDARRSFEKRHFFRFTANTCFVLTRLGIEFVRLGLLEPLRDANARNGDHGEAPLHDLSPHSLGLTTPASSNHRDGQPYWDSQRRELWFDHEIVKRFRVPAPHQEIVLAVFQEENWPTRIDDPLPPQPAIDPKRQLHAVISSLNRHQKRPLLHFSGDGTGTGVLWERGSNGEAAD